MGCDAFTSKDGKLVIEIRDYETGRLLETVSLPKPGQWLLPPNHPISVEYLEGEQR